MPSDPNLRIFADDAAYGLRLDFGPPVTLGILNPQSTEEAGSNLGLDLDLEKVNAGGTSTLLLPTTCVVDADGNVSWIDVHLDYTTRSEHDGILAAVHTLLNHWPARAPTKESANSMNAIPPQTDPGKAAVPDYPRTIAPINHVEPVPRRIRASIGGSTVLDTTAARYVWEWPNYPQFYIPFADIDQSVLVDEHREQHLSRGTAKLYGLKVGEEVRNSAARVYTQSPIDGITGTVRFEWDAMDCWFEEDEQVFVHPRNPYTRVDALRSSRTIRVELNGHVLAQSSATVMVFETGLPTRYYFDRTAVNFDSLRPTATITACPYKGNTSEYWSVMSGEEVFTDLAWCYGFPTRQLLPIAGLISFYNGKVDVFIDDQLQERPITHFSK